MNSEFCRQWLRPTVEEVLPGRRVACRKDDHVRAQGRTVFENNGATVRPVLLNSCWRDQVDLTFID